MPIDKDKRLILNRIKSYYHFKRDVELARLLNINSNTLANWKKRNRIDLELILTKCEELNATWICTGTGKPTNHYPNLENEPISITEEAYENLRSSKDLEIERLRELLAAHEATIAAQAKAMEMMQKLINAQDK